MIIDPLETLRWQWRTRRAHCTQLAQIVRLARLDPRLHTRSNIRRARPKESHARILGKLPQRANIRIGRAAIILQHRRTNQQPPYQQVPHHPARGREPEKPVLWLQIHFQADVFHVLEQDATLPMHYSLRQASRTRRIEHPQGMIEGHLLKDEFGRLPQQFLPRDSVPQTLAIRLLILKKIRHHDSFF